MNSLDGTMSHVGENATPDTSNRSNSSTPKDLSERLNQLRQQLNSDEPEGATAWRAEPGDELAGVFREWSKGTTSRGETHHIAHLDDAHGQRWAVWTLYVALREELRKADPKPGDLVAIRRLDDGKAKESGQVYRRYKVVCARTRDQAAMPADGELF